MDAAMPLPVKVLPLRLAEVRSLVLVSCSAAAPGPETVPFPSNRQPLTVAVPQAMALRAVSVLSRKTLSVQLRVVTPPGQEMPPWLSWIEQASSCTRSKR